MCIYVYIYIYVYAYMYTYNVCMYVYAHIYIYTYMYATPSYTVIQYHIRIPYSIILYYLISVHNAGVHVRGRRVLLTEIPLARIARQGTVCLISIRGEARTTRIIPPSEHGGRCVGATQGDVSTRVPSSPPLPLCSILA